MGGGKHADAVAALGLDKVNEAQESTIGAPVSARSAICGPTGGCFDIDHVNTLVPDVVASGESG